MSWKFPISSDNLELLCALDQATSLEQLANLLHREKSVISKKLKSLSMTHGNLIEKNNRKWTLSEAGHKVVKSTKEFTSELYNIVPAHFENEKKPSYLLEDSVLMLVNPQKAYLNQTFGKHTNSNAINNIQLILEQWRLLKRKVIFAKHESINPESVLALNNELSEFIPELLPRDGEQVLKKKVTSAFADVDFQTDLNGNDWGALILVGFTAAECIDATAKDANKHGLETFVVADAIDTPGLLGPNGEIFHSDLVLGVALANLHKGIAKVLDTKTLIHQLS